MIQRRVEAGYELDAPRRAVLPYVDRVLGPLLSDSHDSLSPLELAAVTGLVSGSAELERHSAEEDLRYEIFMADTRQNMGEAVDDRHLLLGAVVRAASELKRRSEPAPQTFELPVLAHPSTTNSDFISGNYSG